MVHAIETQGLTKIYGNKVAVADSNLHVDDREIFGLLGPNGAGKTTTAKMLATLLRPTSGRAWVGGFDIVKERGKIRKIMGYLPQQLTSDDTLTGYENLLFYAKLYGLSRELREKRIGEALGLVGLRDSSRQMVGTYSGGMKRRLELASVLVSRPRILFLDEPTLGLDPRSRRLVWDFLKDLRDSFETTIFLTTNYMDEADKLCDRVAIIDLGKIVVDGPPARLKESVGGDVIALKMNGTQTNAQEALKSHPYVKHVEFANDSARLIIEGKSGENTIPLVLADLRAKGVEVVSVTLHKPSLDDVFTRYTGKRFVREVAMGGPRRMKQRARMLRAVRQ